MNPVTIPEPGIDTIGLIHESLNADYFFLYYRQAKGNSVLDGLSHGIRWGSPKEPGDATEKSGKGNYGMRVKGLRVRNFLEKVFYTTIP